MYKGSSKTISEYDLERPWSYLDDLVLVKKSNNGFMVGVKTIQIMSTWTNLSLSARGEMKMNFEKVFLLGKVKN